MQLFKNECLSTPLSTSRLRDARWPVAGTRYGGRPRARRPLAQPPLAPHPGTCEQERAVLDYLAQRQRANGADDAR